jgi:methionine-rich copper-binding protein CopC
VNRRLFPIGFALLLILAPTASAHSLLIASVPAAGALVSAVPSVALRFNNRIEKKLSRIRLIPPEGGAQPLALRADGDVDTLEAPLPALVPGRYRVEWRVLSTDGHVVSGAFAFTVTQ